VPRYDHDPVTLAPKGLLLEETRTDIEISSAWQLARLTLADSTDFSIFVSGIVCLLAGNGTSSTRGIFRVVPITSATRTFGVFLRRGTKNCVQLLIGGDDTGLVNYDLLTGVVGLRGMGILSATIVPWYNGWYRCTYTVFDHVYYERIFG
jgi:hypothetical protein